jgi:hypothetical protein
VSAQLSFIAPEVPPPTSPSERLLRIEFDEWFRPAYPKRPNNHWDEAFEAYKRARKIASAEEILEGLRRYQFSPDPQFRRMASTWLNKKSWRVVPLDLTVDAWGLSEWVSKLPPSDGLSAAAYGTEALQTIMLATELPPDWRGDLSILNQWLRDGYDPESVASVIRVTVKEFGPRSLRALDGRVRAKAQQPFRPSK